MIFRTYDYQYTDEHQKLITRRFVVLKHDDGHLSFTDFHRYIRSRNAVVTSASQHGNTRFEFIIPLLNYAFFEEGCNRLCDLTIDIVQRYLNRYVACTLPGDTESTHRNRSTVERGIRYIMDFLAELIAALQDQLPFGSDDLYRVVSKQDKHGHVYTVKVPLFDVRYADGYRRPLNRDIPDKAFHLLFSHIYTHHPELLGLIILGAFAGLRPAEACNVRRADSRLGPGIIISKVDGDVAKVSLDLTREIKLRSDSVNVGFIKKARVQEVPRIFLRAFIQAYDRYTEYLKPQAYEETYGPFAVNAQGKAMTYDTYRRRFQQVVAEMIPIYLASEDPELVYYGKTLQDYPITPHIFRHWYTVQLVLSGITDLGTLMYLRGDTSKESSLTYLQNKRELEKQYRKVNDEMFNYFSWAAVKNHVQLGGNA